MRRLWMFAVILLISVTVPAQNCPPGDVGNNCRSFQERQRAEEERRQRQDREDAERRRQERERQRDQEDRRRQEWQNHCRIQRDDARCYQ